MQNCKTSRIGLFNIIDLRPPYNELAILHFSCPFLFHKKIIITFWSKTWTNIYLYSLKVDSQQYVHKFITKFMDIVETLLSKFDGKILLLTEPFDKLNLYGRATSSKYSYIRLKTESKPFRYFFLLLREFSLKTLSLKAHNLLM